MATHANCERIDLNYAIMPFSRDRKEFRFPSFGSHCRESQFRIVQVEAINGTGEVTWQRNAESLIVTSTAGMPDTHANVIKIHTTPEV